MKTILKILIIASAVAVLLSCDAKHYLCESSCYDVLDLDLSPRQQFQVYLQVFNKSYYDFTEYTLRFNNFVRNMKLINHQNSKQNRTWTAGWTHLTDHSPDEYNTMLGTIVPPPTHPSRQRPRPVHMYNKQDLKTLPESIDWRAQGWVSDVKDQGQCGSCWAFSAVGAMEGQHANVSGNLVSLSEQNLVDCVSACSGCGGGWMNYAMEYVVLNNGVDTEKGYPYAGVDESCNFTSSNVGATFYEVVNITQGDTDGLLHALATIGPISVAIDAEQDLMNYQSGIYTSTTCSTQALDHGVTVVGYGSTSDGTPFYIIKNSWSTSWGLDGYVYWNRTDPNMCGIAQAASYPLAVKTNTTLGNTSKPTNTTLVNTSKPSNTTLVNTSKPTNTTLVNTSKPCNTFNITNKTPKNLAF